MLTQDSVPFLFDLGLIPVWSLLNFHSIPVQSSSDFPSNSRQFPTCFSVYLPPNPNSFRDFPPRNIPFPPRNVPFPSLSRQIPLPFASNLLFPLPDKFPLYNIIMCPFPSPTFPFPIINYQNLPLPQPFTFLFNFFSKKSPFIFVSYLLMPYFCIRFPRDGQHLILTCCNGVGPALQNNKNNFLFIWIIIIKVVIFAVRFAERGPLVVFSFPFAQRGLEIKDGHWEKKLPKTFGSLK